MTELASQFTRTAGLGGATAKPKGAVREFLEAAGAASNAGEGPAQPAALAASPFAAQLKRLTAGDFRGPTALPGVPAPQGPHPTRDLAAEARYVPGVGRTTHGAARGADGAAPSFNIDTNPAAAADKSASAGSRWFQKIEKADFQPGAKTKAGHGTEHERLTRQAEKWVAQTFFGTLLKQMHESPFKSKILDGGHGGQAFSPLYDQHLAERMSRGAGGRLVRSLVRQIEGRRAYGSQALKAPSPAQNARK